jgi:hypothetical protein
MNPRTAYQRDYQRQRRQKAKAAGKCGECSTKRPRDGLSTCDDCITRRIQRRHTNRPT